MRDYIKPILLIVAISVVFFLLGIFMPRCGRESNQKTGVEAEIKRDTITYVDTVKHTEPTPTQASHVNSKEITVATTGNGRELFPRIEEDIDTIRAIIAELNADNDSVRIILPIEQKVYEDNDYKAYVSGYDPKLDSIFVYPKREVITNTIKQPPKRWHIGPTVGYGYTPQGFQPFVGISITYSVLSF